MMRTAICLISAMLFACNQPARQQATAEDSTVTDQPQQEAACYIKTQGKDTLLLQYVVQDGVVQGTLRYNFYEKDKSSGSLSGTLKDRILRAEYHYQSEGQESVRKVVFKIDGGSAYEAVADAFDKDGLPQFPASDTALKFDAVPYLKTACQ